MPSAAIVVVTWNAVEHTRRCLESLAASGVPRERVIAVDNGSTDGTLSYLRSTGALVLENGRNLGFARAVNRGIEAAPADADVLLLNNDVVVPAQGWFDQLRDHATALPGIGALSPRLVHSDGRLQDAGTRIAWDPLCLRHYGAGEPDLGQFSRTREVPAISFACAYLRRDALKAVGFLDEDFFAYFEDVDLCLRMRLAGFRILCCGDVTVAHGEHASTRENEADLRDVFQESERVFSRKWPGSPFPSRGDLLALGYPDLEPETIATSRSLLLGLEDQGWRVSYRNRLAWGTPLDEVEPADVWSSFFQAQRFRVPTENPRTLLIGSPLGPLVEEPGTHAAAIGFAGDRPPVSLRSFPKEMETFSPWTYQAERLGPSTRVLLPRIDRNYFVPAESAGREEQPFTVLFVGPWSPRADVERAVAIFRNAFPDPGEARLRIAATGAEIPPRSDRKEVEVLWLPWASTADRLRLYRAADVFLAPGGHEPWGLYLLEAAACGVPVVAPRSGSLGELLGGAPFFGIDAVEESRCLPAPPTRGTALFGRADPEEGTFTLRRIRKNLDEARDRARRATSLLEEGGFFDETISVLSDTLEAMPPAGGAFAAGEPPPSSLVQRAGAALRERIGPAPATGDGTAWSAATLTAAMLARLADTRLHLGTDSENGGAERDALRREVETLRTRIRSIESTERPRGPLRRMFRRFRPSSRS